MKYILPILRFLWANRAIIAAIIPLAIAAQKEFVSGADKKQWVTSQLLRAKDFTSDEIDLAIDAVVQLLQWKKVL